MKTIKRYIALAALILLVLSLCGGAYAMSSARSAAEALNKLGLFNGVGTKSDGSVDFDLSSEVSRETAATMLVRVLGKEREAENSSTACKFNDVSSWAKKNVAWANANGYMNGYSTTSFGGNDEITAQQYITMLLRVLGYQDSGSSVDFSYDSACSFAKSIGLTDGSYTNNNESFTRGDLAIVTYSAIYTNVKDSAHTLYETFFGTVLEPTALVVPQQTATSYTNSAPGTNVAKSADGLTVIDYSNSDEGYVMVKTTQSKDSKLVVMMTCPSGVSYKYFYTSAAGVYEAFPLTEGSGTYKVGVYKNTSGTKYATLYATSINVNISDSLSPYLRPNFYVDYASSTKVVQYADELCKSTSSELEKVDLIYNYVIKNYTYDYNKAATVESGYRPDLDSVYAAKKGICFDYAAVMTSMLRSQNVATKLVVGYNKTVYHAWISVYTKEAGWIESVIYFDGTSWKLMDPTYASSGNTDFIKDSSSYSARYVY